MAYTLGNKCAKNICKCTVLVQFIIEKVVTFFLRHSVVNDTLFTAKRLSDSCGPATNNQLADIAFN